MAMNERARSVLNQVVTLHYNTCEPVGSTLISKTGAVPFSPATIRNIMMRLETQGYLSQPHTSAGRLPTDLGYRTYVNDIVINWSPLEELERRNLEVMLSESLGGPAILEQIADYVQKRTNLMAFHIPFRHCGIHLKHIHFERIDPKRLLVLWVARGGQTFQSLLDIDEAMVNQALLEKTEKFFNHAFTGFSLAEIERNLTTQHEGDVLLGKAAVIARELTAEANRFDNISFQGVSRLLEMPEFQNIEKVKIVFDLLEQQTKIKNLIRRIMESRNEWIMFFIGREMEEPNLESLTLVLAKFRTRHDFLGCVGVLGPKRMPYLKSLQILAFAKDKVANLPF